MKRFILSLILVLPYVIGLNSCSLDDDNGNNSNVNYDIVGSWYEDGNKGITSFESNGDVKGYSSVWNYVAEVQDYTYGIWTIDNSILNIKWIGTYVDGKLENSNDKKTDRYIIKGYASTSIWLEKENGERITFYKNNYQTREEFLESFLIGSWEYGYNFKSDGSYTLINESENVFGTWETDGYYLNLLEKGYYNDNGSQNFYDTPKLLTYRIGEIDGNDISLYFTENSRPNPDLDQGGGAQALMFWMRKLSN